MTTGMNPVMFRFLKDNEDPWMILIETQGDPFAAKEAIGKVYEKVTDLSLRLTSWMSVYKTHSTRKSVWQRS